MGQSLDQLLDAIIQAETGGEENPYIRTKVSPKGGSSAFGPAQLTYTTAKDFYDRGKLRPPQGTFFREVMEPMYKNFLKYGKEPSKPGYDPIYEYGGTGGFDQSKHGAGLRALNLDILEDMEGEGLDRIQRWRGKSPAQDPRYFGQARKALGLR